MLLEVNAGSSFGGILSINQNVVNTLLLEPQFSGLAMTQPVAKNQLVVIVNHIQ